MFPIRALSEHDRLELVQDMRSHQLIGSRRWEGEMHEGWPRRLSVCATFGSTYTNGQKVVRMGWQESDGAFGVLCIREFCDIYTYD